MRRINAGIGMALGILALVVWTYVAYQAWAIRTNASYSLHFYPAWLATVLSSCACLGWAMATWSAMQGDGECRCRQYGHMLRGLSEPRCPECGTAM